MKAVFVIDVARLATLYSIEQRYIGSGPQTNKFTDKKYVFDTLIK